MSNLQMTTKIPLVALLSFAVGAGGSWTVMNYRMSRAEEGLKAQGIQLEGLKQQVATNNESMRSLIAGNNESTRSAIAQQNENIVRVAAILEGIDKRLSGIEGRIR